MSLVFFDLEATGFSTIRDQITQIAAKCGDEEFVSYVKCTRKIDEKASEVTGITAETLKDAPPIDVVLNKWFEWMRGFQKPITLIAHNGMGYDFPMLFSEMIHNRIPLSELPVTHLFDSLIWARAHYRKCDMLANKRGQPSYRLGDIYQVVTGETLDGAHDALNDVRGMEIICKPCVDYQGIGHLDLDERIGAQKKKLYGLEGKVGKKAEEKFGKSKSIFQLMRKNPPENNV